MALYDAHEMRVLATASPLVATRYGTRRGPNWAALLGIVALHGFAIAALSAAGVIEVRRLPSELKLIQLSPEAAPPPPIGEPKRPEPVVKLSTRVATVNTPVQASAAPVAVAVVNPIVADPAPVPVPAPVVAAPAGPVSVADLDARAVTIVPPKYPLESRRKREQGTVVLAVTLAPDGAVDQVSVAKSSGFERLDKAALDAVRRWRWSPTLRGGEPVVVRGTVDIPFVLQG